MPVRADSMFILADDLSGAADCAVGGVRAGLSSVVLLDDSACEPAQVIAIDADSRHRSPPVSRAVNAALWRSHSAPGRLFYKKIDSTLRGNFATDMSALAGAGVAIVAPAFPASGRTTREGRVFVNGAPLASTEIWSSNRMRGEADIVAMLRAEGIPAVNVPLRTVRGDLRRELVRPRIRRAGPGGGVRRRGGRRPRSRCRSLDRSAGVLGRIGRSRGAPAAGSGAGGQCLAAAARNRRAHPDGRRQPGDCLPPAGGCSRARRPPRRVRTRGGGRCGAGSSIRPGWRFATRLPGRCPPGGMC